MGLHTRRCQRLLLVAVVSALASPVSAQFQQQGSKLIGSGVLLGVPITLILLAVCGFIYLRYGNPPVATAEPTSPTGKITTAARRRFSGYCGT